jgi:hypothetical protein
MISYTFVKQFFELGVFHAVSFSKMPLHNDSKTADKHNTLIPKGLLLSMNSPCFCKTYFKKTTTKPRALKPGVEWQHEAESILG